MCLCILVILVQANAHKHTFNTHKYTGTHYVNMLMTMPYIPISPNGVV